jgi:hypothetical protein
MITEQIAKVCHEANRAYCQTQGDDTQSAWESAPAWQKESAIKGAQYARLNPEAAPQDQHDAWCQTKLAEGWRFGAVKDPAAKTHPCLVPYGELPVAQRRKDALFRAIVSALSQE